MWYYRKEDDVVELGTYVSICGEQTFCVVETQNKYLEDPRGMNWAIETPGTDDSWNPIGELKFIINPTKHYTKVSIDCKD